MADHPSRAVQDYLKAIHALDGAERMVSPLDVARRLQVRAPSVTGMLKRLADSGWIDYEPGTGARLTKAGVAEARRVIRRHRLVELFLTRVLGLDWSEDVRAFAEKARARSINTPSSAQVVKGLYGEGAGQWRRFRAGLEPVMGLLQPWAETLGYPAE